MKRLFPFLLLVIILAHSCVKDEYELDKMTDPSWNPNAAAPLIHSKLTLHNILEDYDTNNLFVEDASNFLYLVYFDTVYSKTAQEIVVLPNLGLGTNHNFNIPSNIPVGDSVEINFSVTQNMTMPNAERIDSMLLKAGVFGLNIQSDLNYNAKIYVEIPNLTRNGQVFRRWIPYSSTSPLPSQRTYALKDYLMIPDNTSPGADNQIQINYKIVAYGNGNPTAGNYTMSMGDGLYSMRFKKIFGYFGTHPITLANEVVDIKLFNNTYEGILHFEDPYLHVYVSNSMGMPIRIIINSIDAYRDRIPSSSLNITGTGIPNPWDINYPNLFEIGQTKTTTMTLNKTNSNIDAALDMIPQRVVVDINGQSNPLGSTTGNNFALDESRVTVEAQVELPLHGFAQDFTIVDTIALEIGDDNIDELEWMNFRLNIINSFPVDAWVQCYFLDSNDVVLDSLLMPPDQLILAATPGAPPSYITTNTTYKRTDIRKDKAEVEKILGVKNFVIKAVMDTYQDGNQTVKMYSFYNLDVRLGVQAQFKFN